MAEKHISALDPVHERAKTAEPFDAGDPKKVEEVIKTAKVVQAQRAELWKRVMSDEAGRKWVYEFLRDCHCFHATFSREALVMAHSEGERNVGLRVLSELIVGLPDLYHQMLKEQLKETTNG